MDAKLASLLQSSALLERCICHQKISRGGEKYLKKQPMGFIKQAFWQIPTFLAWNLMYQKPTRFIKRTLFFCHMTSCPTAGKFTNTPWLLLTWPAVTKRLSLWPRKTLPKLRRLFSRFTGAALRVGHRCCKVTLGVSSSEAWPKKWKITNHTTVVGALKLTKAKLLWRVKNCRHTHRVLIQPSICSGNAPAFWPAVDCVGQFSSKSRYLSYMTFAGVTDLFCLQFAPSKMGP